MPVELRRRIARSMADAAGAAGVEIVTGDTKVVNKGACDKMFITITGIGTIHHAIDLGAHRARPGDRVLVSGVLGDHGATILCARGDMSLDAPIESDCAPLHQLVAALMTAAPQARFLRDPTRGGVAEGMTPIREEIRAFCEILELDPLYLANEGKIIAIVPPEQAAAALRAMRDHPLGRGASDIGEVTAGQPGRVTMKTTFGGARIVDMLVGEQLPRIC
jgi:hydrogenase expression/formation protein HypE